MKRTLATGLALLISCLALVVAGPSPARAKDMNCGDFASQAAAQNYFLAHGGPGYDPDGLDYDSDGVACESNSCPCFTGTSKPKPQPIAQPVPTPKLRVVKVVRGDLIRVQFGAKPSYVVHLMGVTLPGNACKRAAALRDLRSWIKPRMVVRQEDDRPSANRDSRGYLNRYLIRVNGGYEIGGSQVKAGYGIVNRNLRFVEKTRYLRFERTARAQGKGYFGSC